MVRWFWMTVTFTRVLGWTRLIKTEHSASWHQRERSAQLLTHCHLLPTHTSPPPIPPILPYLTPSPPHTHTVYTHELQSDRRVSKQYPIPGVHHCRRWRLAKVTQSSFLTPSLPLFPPSLPRSPFSSLLLSLPRSLFSSLLLSLPRSPFSSLPLSLDPPFLPSFFLSLDPPFLPSFFLSLDPSFLPSLSP